MKMILIAAYLIRVSAICHLRWLNLRHLQRHRDKVPEHFPVDLDLLDKTARYTRDQTIFALIRSVYDSALLLVFLFTPLFPGYDAWISSLSDSFVLRGGLFAALYVIASSILEIPFSLYGTFRLERHYGFNTTAPALWMSDFLKKSIISSLLIGLAAAAAMLLVQHSPALWWLWFSCCFILFSFTITYLSPYLIEPLFAKFEALGDVDFEEEIRALLQKGGLQVKGVMRMDASRRSLHSNAYVSGFGSGKRIVLYDTLIERLERPKLLAILAHEAGHWKKGHIWKKLVLTEATAVGCIFLTYRLIDWGGVPGLFRVSQASFPSQIVMICFLISIVIFPFTPIISWLSRRRESEADHFAAELTCTPHALVQALIKLSGDNLANLHPHPSYASFFYSHPPIVERVARLMALSSAPDRECIILQESPVSSNGSETVA